MIFFSGEELVARLPALVPPRRMHLVHYFGVLAPNTRLRKQVVPEPPEEPEGDPCGQSVAYAETRNGRTIRHRWVPWAQLPLKVFSIEVMVYPECDSRMQRTAVIQQPSVITAILDCLRQKEQPP